MDEPKYQLFPRDDEPRREADRTNPKEILGATKPMLGLNPPVALLHMAKAFEFGAYGRDANGVQVRPKGYGEYNWRKTDIRLMVYVHAILRHVADLLDGEDVASDSKVKHLGHIMACCAIGLDAEECGTLIDDRPPKGKAGNLIERMTIKKPAEVVTIPAPAINNEIKIKGNPFSDGALNRLFDRFFKAEAEKTEKEMFRVPYLERIVVSKPGKGRGKRRAGRQAPARQGKGRGRKPRRSAARH